ncbi:hypothetical protein [Natrialba aegyptia]|uniref:Uncharacterized protein n=1 Tax=Natrialba aegyptia DSM 13077 TaxID=1227491 RepID=M0ALI1_9EURY|nr:hypothetical protein [Natrialba aegyptia]ELY99555.1 hypothetical protein C480_19829 [Natrialba aegyptia DSM 13077]
MRTLADIKPFNRKEMGVYVTPSLVIGESLSLERVIDHVEEPAAIDDRIETDSGQSGNSLAEAKTVAGLEGQHAEELEAAKRERIR